MTINDIYKNRRLYKYFCYFQKRFSIFTYFLVATIVCVSLCEPFVPNVTDIIMALFHSLDFFKGSEDEGAAGLGNFVKSIYYGY